MTMTLMGEEGGTAVENGLNVDKLIEHTQITAANACTSTYLCYYNAIYSVLFAQHNLFIMWPTNVNMPQLLTQHCELGSCRNLTKQIGSAADILACIQARCGGDD